MSPIARSACGTPSRMGRHQTDAFVAQGGNPVEFSETLLREGNLLEILSAVINPARELLRLGVHGSSPRQRSGARIRRVHLTRS